MTKTLETVRFEGMLKMRQFPQALTFLESDPWTDADIIDMAAELGEAFVRGRNAMQNFELGFPLLRRAADLGNSRAMLALSAAYDHGLGVEKDENEGFAWLRKAANAGSGNAEQWTAQRYDKLKDWANSAIWWERCAQGKWSTYPQRTLAAMYRDGRGVDKDPLTAYIWANIASNPTPTGADADAVKLRDEVAKELTAEQLAEGQKRSWEWRSTKEA